MNDIVHRAKQIYQDGLILIEHKYYVNALSCFEQAIDLNPDFAQSWFQIAGLDSFFGIVYPISAIDRSKSKHVIVTKHHDARICPNGRNSKKTVVVLL